MLTVMSARRWLGLYALIGCGRVGFAPLGEDARAGADTPRDSAAAVDGALGSANVQTSKPIGGADGLTFTIEPTQPGTLLVASIAFNSQGTLALPPGWQLALMDGTAGACSALLAYELANPGGVTSLTFTLGGNTPIVGMISEWAGPSALGVMGSTVQGQPSITQSVQAANPAPGMELAITTFCEDDNNPTFTPGAGWSQLGQFSNVASSPSLASDARFVPAGAVDETITSSVAGKYAAVIATFR